MSNHACIYWWYPLGVCVSMCLRVYISTRIVIGALYTSPLHPFAIAPAQTVQLHDAANDALTHFNINIPKHIPSAHMKRNAYTIQTTNTHTPNTHCHSLNVYV